MRDEKMLKRSRSSSVGLLSNDVVLKRHRPSSVGLLSNAVVSKRHRPSSVEFLPDDVVELILERLPVESLLRFKSVSKKWKSTINSRRFQEAQLIHRRQSRSPDILYVYLHDAAEARIVLGSSIFSTVRFPFRNLMVCYGSCDGLVCLSCVFHPNIVVNPATQWHRSFPFSGIQQLTLNKFDKREYFCPTSKLGFGKDKVKGTYKPVWLYNSSEFGLDNVSTCEVFDFSTNAWRYVVPASPYQLLVYQKPVFLDGSLYWLTDCLETKVLSFDLHTETFQVVTKAPFAQVHHYHNVVMFVLDNRLCVSQKNWPTQVIWSFDSGTWKKMCCIDLTKTGSWFGESKSEYALLPVAFLEKNKLLLYGREYKQASSHS